MVTGFIIPLYLFQFFKLDSNVHADILKQLARRDAGEEFDIVDPLEEKVRTLVRIRVRVGVRG